MIRASSHTRGVATAAFAAAMMCLASPVASAQTVAIANGTVYPVSGPRIDRGTVVIENGRITAVGAGVPIPAGATVIDASGKWVTPGFIHATAQAGGGVASLFALSETSREGDVTPSFNPRLGIDPEATTIPVARTGGITAGIIQPVGSFLPGQSVAIRMAGQDVEAMTVRSPSALVVDLSSSSRAAGGGSRAGAVERLRRLFADALELDRRRADFQQDAMQDLSASSRELDALLPVVQGRLVVLINANRKMDIENALRLREEFDLRMVLGGGVEAWKVADKLAAANVPVIVDPTTAIPRFDGLGARLDNATLLREAGVTVILAGRDSGGERHLRFKAGNAVRNGMSWEDALAAITLRPAEAFGLDGDHGSLAEGKEANVVVWSGDPFEFSTRVERLFIRGVEASLRTREHELRDRYRTLPPRR